jgi:hypothetical protein
MDPVLATVQAGGFLLNIMFAGMYILSYLEEKIAAWVACIWSSIFFIFAGLFLWGFLTNTA